MNVNVIGFATAGKSTAVGLLEKKGFKTVYYDPWNPMGKSVIEADVGEILSSQLREPELWPLFEKFLATVVSPDRIAGVRARELHRFLLHQVLDKPSKVHVWTGGTIHRLISLYARVSHEVFFPEYDDLIELWPLPNIVVSMEITPGTLESRKKARGSMEDWDEVLQYYFNYKLLADQVLEKLREREVKVFNVSGDYLLLEQTPQWKVAEEEIERYPR